MSKIKCIDYREHGFWAYDVGLGIFLKYLIDSAEASAESQTPWLSNLISSWRITACIVDCGFVVSDDWSSEERRTFIALAKDACATIGNRTSITAEEMVSWQIFEGEGIFPRGHTEVPTAPIVELGQAIIALVCGQLPLAPKGKAWLYGTSTGREEVSMRY